MKTLGGGKKLYDPDNTAMNDLLS